MRFFFSRIFPLPFILAGALTLYFGCRSLQRAKASIAWPTAEGVVKQSSVEYHSSDKGGGTYHAEVMYDFVVKGTTFSGNRVAFGDYGSSNPSHARGIVNRYPQGKAVTVHHMPGNPEDSVLEPGVQAQAWFLPVFGLIFFVVGCLMAVFLPKAMKKQAAAHESAQAPEVSDGPAGREQAASQLKWATPGTGKQQQHPTSFPPRP
jgi:hypothetical protein